MCQYRAKICFQKWENFFKIKKKFQMELFSIRKPEMKETEEVKGHLKCACACTCSLPTPSSLKMRLSKYRYDVIFD